MLVASTVVTLVAPRPTSRRLLAAITIAAAAVDLDAVGRPFGRGDVAWLGGHRTLTHSLTFALVLGVAIGFAAWLGSDRRRWGTWGLVAACAIATHGLLDAMTTYGGGVAFLAPWSWARYKFAWQPLSGVWPEVLGLWLPSVALLWWASTTRRGGASGRYRASA